MMKKELRPAAWIYPQPAAVIATYDNEGHADAMLAAWTGIYDTDRIGMMLDHNHKTVDNLKETGAFTYSMATVETMAESDYFGSVSGHDKENKIETAGFHASKSAKVNAPVIEEYPLTFECEVEKVIPEGEDFYVVGKIKGILADESILTHGRPDPDKLHALAFDGVNRTYLEVKDKAGMAWAEGRKFIKR